MIKKLRKRRLLAPVLCGTLLTGGCELLGTSTAPLTPPRSFGDKASDAGAQPGAAGRPAGPRGELPPDQTAVLGTPRPGQPSGRRDPISGLEPEPKEATTVDYIPPGPGSPYSPAAALPQAKSAQQTTAGRVMTLTPGEFRIDRDNEMAAKLNAGEPDARKLDTRVQQLDRLVRQSGTEVQAANDDLRKTAAQVDALRNEVNELRAQLRKRDSDDIESLQRTVKALEKLAGEESTAPEAPRN
jgi:hypothetical protein